MQKNDNDQELLNAAEFDKFAEEYTNIHATNITLSGEDPEYFADYKIKDVQRVVKEFGFTNDLNILDFGAGTGTSTPYFKKYFPNSNVTCLDVSEKSLEIGRTRFSELATFVSFDGTNINLNKSFDIIFAACVFHHINPDYHQRLFNELRKNLVPGGVIIIYEHNPLNPLTIRAVNTCPFDENAILIKGKKLAENIEAAGFSKVNLSYRVFFPKALSFLRPLEKYLQRFPLGAQYYVSATKNI